jgi:hypothetical protein
MSKNNLDKEKLKQKLFDKLIYVAKLETRKVKLQKIKKYEETKISKG